MVITTTYNYRVICASMTVDAHHTRINERQRASGKAKFYGKRRCVCFVSYGSGDCSNDSVNNMAVSSSVSSLMGVDLVFAPLRRTQQTLETKGIH